MKVHELLEQIASIPGTNNKIDLLKANMSPLLVQIWEDTYDKSKRYYVKDLSKYQPELVEVVHTIDANYSIFHGILENVATRMVTGDRAKALILRTIYSFVPEDRKILFNIVDRNLRIGVTLDNFRKAAGVDAVTKKFEVALASLLEDTNINVLDGNWFASRKIDGCRLITIIDKREEPLDIKFYSRVGKEFTTLSELEPHIRTFAKNLPHGKWVLDGEVCIVDENGDEHFDQIVEQVRRKNYTVQNPSYLLFDMLSYDAFDGREVSMELSSRYDRLAELIEYYNKSSTGRNALVMLEQERIHSQADFDRWADMVREKGWEGFMLRKNGTYESGRLKSLLKVKKFHDAEYKVLGTVTGQVTYNEGGHKQFDAVTALVIEHKGNRVEVGSGLSKSQRLEWYEHPENIIGKTITVKYFQESINKKTGQLSLRFPTLKHVYETDRDS